MYRVLYTPALVKGSGQLRMHPQDVPHGQLMANGQRAGHAQIDVAHRTLIGGVECFTVGKSRVSPLPVSGVFEGGYARRDGTRAP